MSRFSAPSLDLSRIDRRTIFPALSFAAILDARMELLRSELAARGIAYDTGHLETDLGRIQERPPAYREWQTEIHIQDATASVLLAFATGLRLDRLGDAVRTQRLPLVENPRPYVEAPEDWEPDDRYRARIQLAPEALSTAGTRGAYLHHAASASAHIRDVALRVVRRGTPDVGVEVTVLGPDGAPDAALMGLVRERLGHEVDVGRGEAAG